MIGLYINNLTIIKMEPDLNPTDFMSTVRNALIEDTARLEEERKQSELEAEQARIQEQQRRQKEDAILKESVLAAEKDRAEINNSCKEHVIAFVARTLLDCPKRNTPFFTKRIFYSESFDKASGKSTYMDGMLQLDPPNKSISEPNKGIELFTFSYKPANYDVRLLAKFKELGININTWRDDVLSWLTELFTDTAYNVKNEAYDRGYGLKTWSVLISKKDQTDKN